MLYNISLRSVFIVRYTGIYLRYGPALTNNTENSDSSNFVQETAICNMHEEFR